MTTEIQKEETKTADLALACFLSLYNPLKTIERLPDSRKSYFVFEKNELTDELIASFWEGRARVEPSGYFTALRSIKTRLYSEE